MSNFSKRSPHGFVASAIIGSFVIAGMAPGAAAFAMLPMAPAGTAEVQSDIAQGFESGVLLGATDNTNDGNEGNEPNDNSYGNGGGNGNDGNGSNDNNGGDLVDAVRHGPF